MWRLFFISWLVCVGCLPGSGRADHVTVFAAASLKTALDQVARVFEDETGHDVRLSYAGSSALARQIQYGAPAQVFISANAQWMDSLEHAGALAPDSRVDLLGNRLVLIGPAAAPPLGALDQIAARLQAGPPRNGRLAMALVDAVPAGIYGKAALDSLGLWDSLAGHVAQTDNVRAALALVASGAAPLGIVYATDPVADPRVSVVAQFPSDTHPPITYPAAAIAGRDSPAARDFLAFLRSDDAADLFRAQGFTVLQ